MSHVIASPPPAQSLIAPFGHVEGHYMDAFYTDVPTRQFLRDYVSAFYTTRLFQAERFVLSTLARAPSSDADAMALAAGMTDRFAVWCVEGRSEDELLMADASGRTKSWLHTAPQAEGTRLWFGSVVVPVIRRGKPTLGPVFPTLEALHKIYARLLLKSAARSLGG